MRQLYIARIYKPEFEVKNGLVTKMLWQTDTSDIFFIQVENEGDECEAIKRHLRHLKLDPVTEKIINEMDKGHRYKVQMTRITPHMQVTSIEKHLWGVHPKTHTLYF